MNKIKILGEEFEAGDMVEITQKGDGLDNSYSEYPEMKHIGYVMGINRDNPNFPEVYWASSRTEKDMIVRDVGVKLYDITSINKLVYEKN